MLLSNDIENVYVNNMKRPSRAIDLADFTAVVMYSEVIFYEP
jgi:hypothetical protein